MQLQVEYVDISTIKPYKGNAKEHPKEQIEQIKKSMQEFGNIDPIGIWHNEIVEGHGRYMALKELGETQVPIIRLDDLTDEQRRAYALVHNQLTMNSPFDLDTLKVELDNIGEIDMSEFGFSLDGIGEEPQEVQEDDFDEEPPEEPKSKLGDIYQLGNHRCMCGDSTNAEHVAKLMDGAKADMVFTDPPYNVAFNGRSGKFDVIKNDNLSSAEFNKFIKQFLAIIEELNPSAYYICCNWAFYGVLQMQLHPKACIVWAKNVFGLGKGYRHQHEFILFNGKIDESITNESDLWEIKKDIQYKHPTQKPVELSARAIRNSSKPNEFIVDLFGGSGSTLIACEQLNRKCYMMELDPKYVDVIIKRWEEYTGKKAVKIA